MVLPVEVPLPKDFIPPETMDGKEWLTSEALEELARRETEPVEPAAGNV